MIDLDFEGEPVAVELTPQERTIVRGLVTPGNRRDLAERTGLGVAAITACMWRLHAKGLITRRTVSYHDVQYALTGAGEEQRKRLR